VSLTVLLGYKNTLAALGKAPSQAAKSSEYSKSQGDPCLAIHDGRRGENPSMVSTIGPPIQIFHPIFHDFTEIIDNPRIQPTIEDLDNVYQLMQTVSKIYMKEDAYCLKVCEGLGRILGKPILEVANDDKSRPDGVITMVIKTEAGEISIPCAFFELKREAGEGGCDPTSQVSLSMRHCWIHKFVGYNRIHLDPAFDF
jgi:hypothetical protein